MEVPSARSAETQFNLANLKYKYKDQSRLGCNPERNQVRRLPIRVWFEGLFKQGHGSSGASLRQQLGNYDRRRGLRRLVKGKFCLQSPTEDGTGQQEESALERERSGDNLSSL